MKWLFLVHQVHTSNSRERVKVWRAIRKTGALLYRNSVYILPFNKERLEDFQWVCQQINDSQGEASVFVSNAQTKSEDLEIQKLFQKATAEEYASFLATAEKLHKRMKLASRRKATSNRLRKTFWKESRQLQETLEQIRKTDFFSKKPPRRVQQALDRIQAWFTLTEKGEKMSATTIQKHHPREFQHKVWATRKDIHIDRICSAWLIRRFIDPSATFVFAPEKQLPKNAVHFDVFGAEFSHHGEDCTFETLIKSFRIRDRAVREIAEIVHDIDLKDSKFGRSEASGLNMVIRSLSESVPEDKRRLEVGTVILDGLHQSLSKTTKKKK